jgi:hypothetical protein
MKQRRALLGTLAGIVGLLWRPGATLAQGPTLFAEVWKSPTCGCCKDWITHLEANGFRVKVHDVGNAAARARLKIAAKLGSCHTALVGRYAIEGHVPAADIQRLLKERPEAIGLAVPGMPHGSPGMDGPAYGNRQDPYDVLLIAQDGSTRVFSSYFKPRRQA